MKILWSLVFTATVFCTEVDNSVWFTTDQDCKFYKVKHAGKEYKLPIENINKDEGHISLIFGSNTKNDEVVNINHGSTVNNSIAITCAIQALLLVEPLEILDNFFNTDNDHFYDIYNFYSVLVPSNAFKSYFYSIMILKEALCNPNEFNLKAYMVTLDQSQLYTSIYKKKIERLEEINNIPQEKRTTELSEESLLLHKCKQKQEILSILVNDYIRGTLLAKLEEGNSILYNEQVMKELNDIVINSNVTTQGLLPSELITQLYKSNKSTIKVNGDEIPFNEFNDLINKMALTYQFKGPLNKDKLDTSYYRAVKFFTK